jgi:hypothetical protein
VSNPILSRCHESTKSDYIEFSNYMPEDKSYGRKCGSERQPFRLISDSYFFRVTFRSNDKFDGGGFYATFHFTTQPKEILIEAHDSPTHSNIHLLLPGTSSFFGESAEGGDNSGEEETINKRNDAVICG